MSPRTALGMVSLILYFPAAYAQIMSCVSIWNVKFKNRSYMQVPKNEHKENSPDFPGRPEQAKTAPYIISIWLISKYSFIVYNSIGVICRLNLDLAKHR